MVPRAQDPGRPPMSGSLTEEVVAREEPAAEIADLRHRVVE